MKSPPLHSLIRYFYSLFRHYLGLESPEESLLGAEDLHGRRRLLRQIDERPRVRDEPRPHQLTHHDGQVRRDGLHPVAEVVGQLQPVFGKRHHLARPWVNGDQRTHRSWIMIIVERGEVLVIREICILRSRVAKAASARQ